MQTYTDYEIIVSDDSKDDSVRDYCQTTPEIKYFHNGSRGKSSINMNNAFTRATGDIIKPMFNDDYFTDKNDLQEIVDALEGTTWAVCKSSKPYSLPQSRPYKAG
jgi:glycosyltransferase involved in cell wall biosynthesis